MMRRQGDSSRISFFRELQSIVLKDKEDMKREWKKHEEEQNGRERLRVAKLLEIPPDQQHWVVDDWELYSEFSKCVPGWGTPSNAKYELEHQRLAQK